MAELEENAEPVKSFNNHLGFTSDYWLETQKYRFTNLGTILGNLIMRIGQKEVIFEWHSFGNPLAFELGGYAFFITPNKIEPNNFDEFIESNKIVFDKFFNKIKSILIEELESNLSPEDIVLNIVNISPSEASLTFQAKTPKGDSLLLQRSGMAYYEIIAPEIELISEIVQIGKNQSKMNGNPFRLD